MEGRERSSAEDGLRLPAEEPHTGRTGEEIGGLIGLRQWLETIGVYVHARGGQRLVLGIYRSPSCCVRA